ncbi:MAG TPA: hypothetical protein G4O02_03615 [Caldilineae bacterium]|nr:hypothetical protein [Caldilineae bacterium]
MKKIITMFAVLFMVMATVVYAQGPTPGTGNTTVYVTNTDSAGPASVTADYINPNGNTDFTDFANVPYAGQAVFQGSTASLPPSWSGAMVLSSDRVVAAAAVTEWTGGATGGGKWDGITAGAYTGFPGGATQVYAPSIFKRSYQSSKITVQNTDTVTATVTVEFYTRGQSTPVHTVNAQIPPGASKTFDVWDYPQIPTADPTEGPDTWKGAARVVSAQKVAVVVTTHWNWGSSIYSGVSQPSTTLYVPSIFKKKYANWRIYSGLIIMNPNNQDAQLTFYFYNRDGTLAIPPVQKTISAFSSDGFNTRYSPDVFGTVSNDWNGLAVITSTVPVVGIVNNIWRKPTQETASYAMGTADDAATKLYYPVLFRKYTGSWEQWSAAIFQNTTDTDATVTARFYNPDGTLAATAGPITIPGKGAKGLNTRYDSDPGEPLASLPADWTGVAVVESDQPIIGISNLIWTDKAAGYNAAVVQ